MKDPAALLYIDKWKTSTTEMSAICRAYYMDLILHQYDKGDLPNSIEELANICRVRFSEFEQFKQVFEQVLQHKFKQNDNSRLENEFAKEIIQKRKLFKEKRSISGKISYVIRFANKHFKLNKAKIQYLKDHIDFDNIDTKNEQVLKQVIEQKVELYINEDEDVYKDVIIGEDKKIDFELFWNLYDKKRGKKSKIEVKWYNLTKEIQQNILDYIPKYIESQPDKKFRKDPETFLNNESWNDEIIIENKTKNLGDTADENYKF